MQQHQLEKDMGTFTLLYHKSLETRSAMTTRGPVEVQLEPPTADACVYPKGYRAKASTRPLPCAMRHLHNVAIPMRDGVRLYAEVYLPEAPGKYPAIIGWTPFDKGPDPDRSQDGFKAIGMPDSGYISGFETFEGVDPAWWTAHDYAVVNVCLLYTSRCV